jgi:hypothetical protein
LKHEHKNRTLIAIVALGAIVGFLSFYWSATENNHVDLALVSYTNRNNRLEATCLLRNTGSTSVYYAATSNKTPAYALIAEISSKTLTNLSSERYWSNVQLSAKQELRFTVMIPSGCTNCELAASIIPDESRILPRTKNRISVFLFGHSTLSSSDIALRLQPPHR